MLWACDLETIKVNENEVKVCLGYLEAIESNESHLFISLDELFNFLKSYKKRVTHHIYFHNLSYDGEFIIWWLINQNLIPQIDKVDGTNQFHEITDMQGSKIEISVNYKSTRIVFKCSYKMWPVRLKDIGASLGFKKLSCDLNDLRNYKSLKEVPKEHIDYVIRDVQIIKRKYLQYQKTYPIKRTSSGSSWRVFKNWYETTYGGHDFNMNYSISEDWHKHISKAYWGGFTQCNEKYLGQHLKQPIKHFDINSSYPAIFLEHNLPYGAPQMTKPQCDYVELVEATIYDIKKKDHDMIDHLHNWVVHNALQETYLKEYKDMMHVLYVREEWEEICKTYSFKILGGATKSIYFKANKKLKPYIEEMATLKENEQDPVIRNDHKRIINSFTGKWGQSIYQESNYLREMNEDDNLKFKYNNKYVYAKKIEKSKDIKYKPIAIFVTALARVKLLRTIRENKNEFLYCDTDSIILIHNEQAQCNLPLDQNKFGYWKLCHEVEEIKIIKPKAYILKDNKGEIHRTIAGVNKECHHLYNFDNFYVGSTIKDGNLKKRKVNGGIILEKEDITL